MIKGFKESSHPNHFYKLKKTLYGLKQTPIMWYGPWEIVHIPSRMGIQERRRW